MWNAPITKTLCSNNCAAPSGASGGREPAQVLKLEYASNIHNAAGLAFIIH